VQIATTQGTATHLDVKQDGWGSWEVWGYTSEELGRKARVRLAYDIPSEADAYEWVMEYEE